MIKSKALERHFEWKGKIEIKSKVSVSTKDELALAYTPGVADACMAIFEDKDLSFSLTGRSNFVAVITDGTAILGLGDIGPEAGMPVMEGKCALFKEYGGVDAFPLCINSKDSAEIVRTIKLLEGSFGGINLEDISAPRCFEIEERLKEELNIPVFHDDQHGTAIVMGAALLNSIKLANKKIEDIKVVINGAGAAGIAISKYLLDLGVKNLVVCDKAGILCDNDEFTIPQRELAKIINPNNNKVLLKDALVNSDVFIGVSRGNLVTKEMVKTMNKLPILFPCANPVPEISYEDAIDAGAFIVGTGSSKNPNQINNVLVFPGMFRGALDVRSKTINKEMMIAATHAIMESVGGELSPTHILPYAWDKNVHNLIAKKVKEAAIKTKVNRI